MNRVRNARLDRGIDRFRISLPLANLEDGYIRRRANLGVFAWNLLAGIEVYAID